MHRAAKPLPVSYSKTSRMAQVSGNSSLFLESRNVYIHELQPVTDHNPIADGGAMSIGPSQFKATVFWSPPEKPISFDKLFSGLGIAWSYIQQDDARGNGISLMEATATSSKLHNSRYESTLSDSVDTGKYWIFRHIAEKCTVMQPDNSHLNPVNPQSKVCCQGFRL